MEKNKTFAIKRRRHPSPPLLILFFIVLGSSPKYNVDFREKKILYTWWIDLDDIIEAFRLFDAILPCLVFLKFLKSTNS